MPEPSIVEINRRVANEYVASVLCELSVSDSVRGSWKYGDFHLSADGSKSYSDLDLVISEIGEKERHEFAALIRSRLAPRLNLAVSIHPADFLMSMNLDDSLVLSLGEFVAKASRGPQLGAHFQYMTAKITLLLLRQHVRERYLDVAQRIGTPEAERSAEVKLGTHCEFSLQAAAKLAGGTRDTTIKMFVRTCLLSADFPAAATYVCCRIERCASIAPWLKHHLLSKMAEATR